MRLQSNCIAICQSRLIILLLSICASTIGGIPAHAQDGSNSCGSIANHYGPFDYRTHQDKLKIVEAYHFTPPVESLLRGHSALNVGSDIAYTLHTSPNHHRALMAMVRLGEKMKTPQPQGTTRPVECYFERAIRFAPDDTVVRVLYAQFLDKNVRTEEAVRQLGAAMKYAEDDAFSNYNIGLAYFDLGKFDQALAQAHKAAALGFERTELRELLKGARKWQEPAHGNQPLVR